MPIRVNEDDPQPTVASDRSVPQFIEVGQPPARRKIAYLHRTANSAHERPGIIWLGGFKSDMGSQKATALDAWASETGRALLRFDYSGHGASEGRFEEATIGDWLAESLAVFKTLASGPQILVGSSMGGWIALLMLRAMMQEEKPAASANIAGLVLIAPAVDFTQRLIWERLPKKARADIEKNGVWLRPSPYSTEPIPITQRLIEEGRDHLLFDSILRTHCPVHILHGLKDADVPPAHVMTLLEHLVGDPVVVTSIKDGDHRLSRPEDIACLIAAIETLA
jgi:pimeloyl-ACP methyl ester carboxylesterase